MSTHPTKRDRLKELVSQLGAEASPAVIREKAYREGIGQVHGNMLISVRNELWPARAKHGGGYTAEARTTAGLSAPPPCPACKSSRTSISNSYHPRSGGVRRKRFCRDCNTTFVTEHVETDRRPGREACLARAATLTEKTCTSCKKILAVSCFSKVAGSSVLHRSNCRECLNQKRADRGLLVKLAQHGMTVEQYRKVLANQDGKCAICGSQGRTEGKNGGVSRYPLCFDHCHKTGKFRGLLCDRCNLGIGNFDDDIDRFRAVIQYLSRHQTDG